MALQLQPIKDKDGNYDLQNFDEIINHCKVFVTQNSFFLKPLESDSDKRLCKLERTNLNKELKLIKDTRIQINHLVMDNLNGKFKALEDMLDTASKAHTTYIEEYEKKINDETKDDDKVIKLIVTSNNEEVIKKVEAYANKLHAICKRG